MVKTTQRRLVLTLTMTGPENTKMGTIEEHIRQDKNVGRQISLWIWRLLINRGFLNPAWKVRLVDVEMKEGKC